MDFKTTDLSDEFENDPSLQIGDPLFRDFGGITKFCGQVVTVKVFEDNVMVRSILESKGEGRVLVVDGEGSTWCALLGDQVAEIACENGWSGVVVNGCVRDAVDLSAIQIGVKALASVPRRSRKDGDGRKEVPVSFAGLTVLPGNFLYADEDGILIATRDLLQELSATAA